MEEKNKLKAVKEKHGVSFQSRRPSYEKLALNIKSNLEALLKENSIDFMEVNYRIKESDSFYEKICRKEEEKNIIINNPFEELQDICGIRIICYYVTDLKEVDAVITENFEIVEREYKANNLKENEFGYLSNHYIVRLKEEWFKLPILKGLDNLVAEIQVRTILMHAWADISHKLNYKQKNIDRDFERKLNRLSALFEIADNLFISLKNERQEKYSKEIEKDNVVQEYNIDFMRAALKIFPKMEVARSSDESIERVIKALEKYEIQPIKLLDYLKKIEKKDLEEVIKKLEEKNVHSFARVEETDYLIITSLILNDNLCEYMDERLKIIFDQPEMKKIRDSYKVS